MSDRTNMLRLAAAEVGYKEGANNNNKYGAAFGGNYQPWCAYFISWCADGAGILGSNNCSGIIPRTAWVPDYQSYYQAKGRYQAKGAYIPAPGDIILYGTNSHVGIVESCDGKTVTAIEGNTSQDGNNPNGDGVYRRTRALNNSWIKGYCIPEYKEEENNHRQYVQETTGFDDNTMAYLDKHLWPTALYDKLYQALIITTSREMVQAAPGLDDNTMKYLDGYKFAAALYDKLAAGILDMKK